MVTLETSSTEPGTKDYLAVGTTVDRGEDLAVKGAVSCDPLPTRSSTHYHLRWLRPISSRLLKSFRILTCCPNAGTNYGCVAKTMLRGRSRLYAGSMATLSLRWGKRCVSFPQEQALTGGRQLFESSEKNMALHLPPSPRISADV